jgi:hypothetical protein
VSRAARFAFIGNSLPRRCGIATFTSDLQQAIDKLSPDEGSCIVAMNDHGHTYDYPSAVLLQIADRQLEDYERAADALNSAQYEVVSLQHEFGIFGGNAGGHILALTSRLSMPLVTTLHTVLSRPTQAQRQVLDRIVDASSRVIVMADKGRELLRTVYDVSDEKIEVIPHRTLPACTAFGAQSRAWLLHRRQRACAVARLRAQQRGRSAPIRDLDQPFCRIHSARVESRHDAVPQLHGFRPTLAGRLGI